VITFRHLTPEDLPELHRLEAASYVPALHESDEAFLGLIAVFPEGAFGFFDGAELCAYAFSVPLPAGTVLELKTPLESLPPGGDTLYIHDVAVAERRRGHGLARRLVAKINDVARERGLRTCELVSVQGSAPFWARFGFEAVAEFDYAPGMPATKMRAVLRG
jgi:GNAT superfamily N-acetyltransferase